jgi:phosphoglycolate phosphatase
VIERARERSSGFGGAAKLAGAGVGRTDRWIAARLFEREGIEPTEEAFASYFDAYLEALPEALAARPGQVLPGVVELLEALTDRPEVCQGLLTGNLRRGAQIKLAHFGLWGYFSFGVYGDDTETRSDLGALALQRACEQHATAFGPDQTVVIGDTPHAIECGKTVGARTLAVATGRYTREQLAEHGPTELFGDLADTERVLISIGVAG